MAIWQGNTDADGGPRILSERHHRDLYEFLCEDIPSNLFQLCWLENHGVVAERRPDLFHFAGLHGAGGGLTSSSLAVTHRLALVYASDQEAARRLGRWYRRQGFVFEHIVSADASVTPFWEAYRGPPDEAEVSARLNRSQKLLVMDSERWASEIEPNRRPDYEPTGVGLADPDQLEAIYLASAQMHREETLQDPLQHDPETFRRHVRHRIESGRTFVWFDESRHLLFKADISARGSLGAQLSGVYTTPSQRGQGIATRALFDICEELFEAGLPRVTLYVNAENRAALRVYEKVGFEIHTDFRTVFIETDESGDDE